MAGMHRRRFLKTAGAIAATPVLAPLVARLVGEAHGAQDDRCNLVVLTDGNGWSHQSGGRNAPTLDTDVRDETDWDLPPVLARFAPFRDRVSILRHLYNPHDRNLHGNGWATLSVARGNGREPGGISLDRRVGLVLGGDDAFASIALGVATRPDRAPPCTSCDGPRAPFPAVADPLVAHRRLFGGVDALAELDRRRSVLDGIVTDIDRTRARLAGPERVKLDQALTSYRAIERQLVARQAIFADRAPPDAPAGTDGTLAAATAEGHVGVIADAFRLGLTHVAHLSVLGFDAHNVGWGFLGFGGDAHENVAHVSGGYDRERSSSAYAAQLDYKAGLIARLYAQLDAAPAGDGTLADRTVFVWVNSGGGKHHEGARHHAMVLVGDAGGRLRTGRFAEHGGQHCISEAYLAIINALGVEADAFGDPAHCPGPLPGLLG